MDAFLKYIPEVARLGNAPGNSWVDQTGRLKLTEGQNRDEVKSARTALRNSAGPDGDSSYHKVTKCTGNGIRFLGKDFTEIDMRNRQTELLAIANIITDVTRYLSPYVYSIATSAPMASRSPDPAS
ncbi:hypothetical protein [Streptomyces sp. CBMA152]|uniref:hypothetical protein n=1 Tax=Streptomyces sp. CBMA152 TaxID=1896312 RepID=UPI0016611728|nr:hypothetical protein [Streptomyces sp. CBMA152]